MRLGPASLLLSAVLGGPGAFGVTRVAWAQSALAVAEPAATRAPNSLPRVLLWLDEAADPANDAALIQRLAELDVEISTAPRPVSELSPRDLRQAAARAGATLVIWFSPEHPPAEMFFYDPHNDRIDVRRLPITGNPVADREETLIISSSSVSAWLESQSGGGAQVAGASETNVGAPSPKPPSETPALAESSPASGSRSEAQTQPADRAPSAVAVERQLSLLVGYAGTSALVEAGAWKSGLGSALVLWLPSPVHLSLGYTWLSSQRYDVGESELEVSRSPFTLGMGLGARAPWPQWRWLVADGLFSVERVGRRTRSAATGLVATADEARWLVDVGARLGAAANLVSRVGVYTAVSGKLGLGSFAYVAQSTRGETRAQVGQSTWQFELGVYTDVF